MFLTYSRVNIVLSQLTKPAILKESFGSKLSELDSLGRYAWTGGRRTYILVLYPLA